MRNLNKLVTYDESTGEELRREKYSVMYTNGEPHPNERVITFDFAGEAKGVRKSLTISIGQLEKACGFKIKIVRARP
jgi:hypothetical protein